jgi:hypothetical protein
MADVAAGLLQARRCIHGVAEERDFHLDGAEFANDHGPAMKRGAEVCPEAEVANVGVGAFVQLLLRVEAGADAVPVPKAGGKWPGGNDLIANVFVDYAALRIGVTRGNNPLAEVPRAGMSEGTRSPATSPTIRRCCSLPHVASPRRWRWRAR